MAVKIKFDSNHNVIPPTFILATRNGRKLGVIQAVNINISDSFNSRFELEFQVLKYSNGCVQPLNEAPLWDEITDFKLLWCREWDVWFEIRVQVSDDNKMCKAVSGFSLGEAELSQINLYNLEINTEEDIKRDKYVPTVLCNASKPEGSLLHRMLEKAPHYRIGHVDGRIASLQRTFSFSEVSIYDAFQEVAKEIDCIFVIDSGSADDGSIMRSVSVYDLENYCPACGHRESGIEVCPKCKHTDILPGYGKDTTIFVSSANLGDNIAYSTDVDSVKNCFRMEAGDEMMTAMIKGCNPNGSQYLWCMSDEIKSDMSPELVAKLHEYDKTREYYYSEHKAKVDSALINSYNALVERYKKYDKNLQSIPANIVGFPELMTASFKVIDMAIFLKDGLMVSPDIVQTTALKEAARIGSNRLSPIAVSDISIMSSSTADNVVLKAAKNIVDPRYKVKIKSSNYSSGVWTGIFTVTNYSDEKDTADGFITKVVFNTDYETYVRQQIDDVLANAKSESENPYDIVALFKQDDAGFAAELKKYCLTTLKLFVDACQACLDMMIGQGLADKKLQDLRNPGWYDKFYGKYFNRLKTIQSEIKTRENEIALVSGIKNNDGSFKKKGIQQVLEEEKERIQKALNMEACLGHELWLELSAYRREDTYSNKNYVSDGLSNNDLLKKAVEFVEEARKEIYKSANLQHTISASLKNLLVMKEFSPIVDDFSVGNWIRVLVDKTVYKLRLLTYTIDFNDLTNLRVEFSDVKKCANGLSDSASILQQAASMASTYDAVTRQASQGAKSNKQLAHWVSDGLALTKMKIVDDADNQKVTWDKHGLLAREYREITDDYSDKQLKLINKGLYVTDDDWKTCRAGIGDFFYFDPESRTIKEGYGVVADTIVGNVVLAQNVGIYNQDGSINMTEEGLVITADMTDPDWQSKTKFKFRTKKLNAAGAEVYDDLLAIDPVTGSLRVGGYYPASEVDIKVGDENIINTINASSSGLKIDVNKLNISINDYATKAGIVGTINADKSGVTISSKALGFNIIDYCTNSGVIASINALADGTVKINSKALAFNIGDYCTIKALNDGTVKINSKALSFNIGDYCTKGGLIAEINNSGAKIKTSALELNIGDYCTKDGVISSINASSESIKIKSSKLEIDGSSIRLQASSALSWKCPYSSMSEAGMLKVGYGIEVYSMNDNRGIESYIDFHACDIDTPGQLDYDGRLSWERSTGMFSLKRKKKFSDGSVFEYRGDLTLGTLFTTKLYIEGPVYPDPGNALCIGFSGTANGLNFIRGICVGVA